jgi:tetratricopeptide (TPR) repeat protein
LRVLVVFVSTSQSLFGGTERAALDDSVVSRLSDAIGVARPALAGSGAGATRGAYPSFAKAAGLVAESRVENEAGWNLTHRTIGLAIGRLHEALASAPEFAAAHYLLGLMDARQRRYGDALAAYRRAAQAGPPFSVGPMKALFMRAVSRCQGAAEQVARGTQYLDRGKVQEAGAAYRDAAEMLPDYAEAHANLGLVQMLIGDLQGAVSRQLEAIRLNPGLAEAFYNLGNAYSRQRRFGEAVTAYREAIRLKPESAPPDSVVSNVDAHQGAYTRSVAGYQHARRYAGLANAHFNLGDNEAAIEAYSRAVGLAPDFADGHYNLGVIYERTGDVASAIRHWRAYMKLARDDPAQQAWVADARARLIRLENSRKK